MLIKPGVRRGVNAARSVLSSPDVAARRDGGSSQNSRAGR